MTLAINDDSISSDHTTHTARLVPGHEDSWKVSWLPERLMDRSTAITAMVLADTAGLGDLHTGHRLWPHIEGWAAELGLTAPDAPVRATHPPGGIGTEKDAAPELADLEAARS
jgi:hypothetical protein